MAVRTQRWSPDTCGCVFIQEWDDAVAAAARTHDVRTRELACAAHQGLDAVSAHSAVVAENQRKNIVPIIVKSLKSSLDLATLPWREAWSFDAQRRLVVDTSVFALTAQQKTQLQAAADLQFGPDKVILL